MRNLLHINTVVPWDGLVNFVPNFVPNQSRNGFRFGTRFETRLNTFEHNLIKSPNWGYRKNRYSKHKIPKNHPISSICGMTLLKIDTPMGWLCNFNMNPWKNWRKGCYYLRVARPHAEKYRTHASAYMGRCPQGSRSFGWDFGFPAVIASLNYSLRSE